MCLFLPIAREEVDVLLMPRISPDEAEAETDVDADADAEVEVDSVEVLQTSDDDVPLCCGCRDKEQAAEMRPNHPFI